MTSTMVASWQHRILTDPLLREETAIEERYDLEVRDLNVFYGNFQALRVTNALHVFLTHGESDKRVSVSGQVKAYDYCFLAGRAALGAGGQVGRSA